ncbi:hypothetical protein BUALT_Bualt13G0048700 [Buddleja alternifolia]|uniref:Uncharacterized protein n=1 Tax=Buddleja alternifolia TaxID=168488 RepID=A0AAV6WVW1_9LAMI|nr:hypothetical protein BUALT_Bualt13G0048700 [Buddleja alternifolia]
MMMAWKELKKNAAKPLAANSSTDAAAPAPKRRIATVDSPKRDTTARPRSDVVALPPQLPTAAATLPPLSLVLAFSVEKPTTSKTPPTADHDASPPSSSPIISSRFSSSRQSPGDSPPQRSHLDKGKSVLPPSSKLGGFTTFKSKVQQTRYNALCRYPIIPGKCVDYDALNVLNICDEFVALVDGIGWSGYFHVKLPAFIELTREFYTTFKFNKTKDLTLTSPGVVKFRLMDKDFSYSINQFNVALGFVDNDYDPQPKKRKRRDMEEPSRDTTSSTPETSNMHSFSRHFEDRLNRIESKLDRILAHFHIPPD